MYLEKLDSAVFIISQYDAIMGVQHEIIQSYERTISNDSLIIQQNSIITEALEKKLKRQKIYTRGFQTVSLILMLLWIF